MLKKIKEFYTKEYESTKKILVNCPTWVTPKEVVNCSLQRCLGVAFFAQEFGIPYEAINEMYGVTKKRMEKLIKRG